MRTRESGASMAVGWFLTSLAIGSWLPRTGRGLFYIIATSENPNLWRLFILISGMGLVICSYGAQRKLRAYADVLAIFCWASLAIVFLDAQLWGAALQAGMAILILFECLFRLRRGTR